MEIILGLVLCGILSLLILNPFGKGGIGFLLGLLLGPFGLFVALIERSNLRRAEQDAHHRELLYVMRKLNDSEPAEMPWDSPTGTVPRG